MKTILSSLITALALTAGAQSTNVVKLEWNPNTETNLAYYVVAYGTNIGWTTNGQAVFTGPPISSTNFTIGSLATGPTYSFAVQAVDTDGLPSEWSDEVQWKSKRIGKPTGVKRTITVNVKVEVSQ